ncbi:[FeFe] hydrogenase H-cluster radical SAM maturase HydE [bacterium]|nr:[FeFe] hydrogenase H-cluster radical SAM maturase HydE [bacterium]
MAIDILKKGKQIDKTFVVDLLESADKSLWDDIFSLADFIREQYMGNAVHLRGIIEFSNICKRSCNYCGLQKQNKQQHRYRMMPEEILKCVSSVAELGIKTVVLQSGEDDFYTLDILVDLIKQIKKNYDVAITLSIGEKTKQEYRALHDAGADRYLLRHETASPELYNKLHPDSCFEDRLKCIKYLFETGFQVGIGSMIGLPGQTNSNMADDILFLQKFQPDMIGTGPFIPNGQTQLKGTEAGTIEQTLKITALARIVCRKAHIPATTATGTIDKFGREKALHVGANVIMPNFTPQKYRVHYTIYPNKRCITEDGHKCNTCIRAMIINEGRTIASDYGHALRFQK